MPEDTNVSDPLDRDEEVKRKAKEAEAAVAEAGKEAQKKEEETPPKEESPKEPEEKEEAGEEGEPEPEKPKEPEEPKKGEEGEEEGEEEKPKRTPKLMPTYKHKIAEKKWEQERVELKQQITDLSSKVGAEGTADRQKLIDDFAEKHGLEPDMVSGLVKILEGGQISQLTKRLDELQTEIKSSRQEREELHQSNEFEKEYEEKITPLLKDVPEDSQKKIKILLKTLAFTTEYSNTPLPVIYRGVEDFDELRSVTPTKGKKSGEASRGGVGGEVGEDKPKSIGDMTVPEYEEFIEKQDKRKFDVLRPSDKNKVVNK